jgi:hypothetical protein
MKGMTNLNSTQSAIITARLILIVALTTFAIPLSAQEENQQESEPGTDSSTAETAPTSDDSRRQTESPVMDRIELDTAEITGNQELPKVLYIVPWKDSDPDALPGPPVGTLLDEEPAPIDREELARQVEYYDALYGKRE